ncbi:hypothetical protein [Pantoea cypripedii]|uniref:DUF4056 domain-containing protein n=1 Tax=Pantoea cypripedii TaxID=55209 RepID=A0A6B9G8J8_PANCY|nr:hypothetical protein [Pantoea cypripedii]QGY28436.1 hypothetical protein CUN67_05600 [Pantoea cypripedii]
MSKRSDIIDGSEAAKADYGLIYTEVLGWVDLGHAKGDDIRKLMNKINHSEAMSAARYDITYSQSMADPWRMLRMGKFATWRVRKGRPYKERQSIALAMMMAVARRFEAFQDTFPINLVTDSGFSGEDLCSDLLGFYRVMRMQNPFPLLQPVSKQEALKRWDYYGKIGTWKNETFQPLLFPDPKKFPNAKPYLSHLPNFMQTIRPYDDWKSGNVCIASADGNYLQSGQDKDMMG